MKLVNNIAANKMNAYYYQNGSWIAYNTAKDFIVSSDKQNVSFKFISNTTMKETVANGKLTPFGDLGISKSIDTTNILYYKRIGTTGPSIFAINFSDITNTKIIDSKNNNLIWLFILAGIGYYTLG